MKVSWEWLLDPVTSAKFFEVYYERKALWVERQDRTRFDNLLSLDAIDRFLATTSPCYPDVFLVDATRPLSGEDYTRANDGDGSLDLPRMYDLFRGGATISIRRMHERHPALAALCRALESVFSAHFQTNVYLSPPNAQGFGTHFDSHDVFVLQISGSKTWSLYDTLIELPLHEQRFEKGKHIPGPVTQQLTIRAGDLLYCPRGLFHSAHSTDEPSLHVTLGLMGKTWADVLAEAVSAASLAHPALRANLPVGFANPGFDMKGASDTFRSLLESFVRCVQVGPMLERFATDFTTSRRPDFRGLLQDQTITLDSKVSPRSHLIYRLEHDADHVTLLFGASAITFPIAVRSALEFALTAPSFKVRDLPGLDDSGKRVLVQRLVREGLLGVEK